MQARARAKYVRISPRKTRLVARELRGKTVDEAMRLLKFVAKDSAPILGKLLKSAQANAAQKNAGLDESTLMISEVQVDGGPIMWRMRPMSMGRSGRIRRRTSHITVTVTDEFVEK